MNRLFGNFDEPAARSAHPVSPDDTSDTLLEGEIAGQCVHPLARALRDFATLREGLVGAASPRSAVPAGPSLIDHERATHAQVTEIHDVLPETSNCGSTAST